VYAISRPNGAGAGNSVRAGLVRVLYPESKDGIDESEVTIGNALQDAGYTTADIGKWHLGHLPQYLPTRHGFNTWAGNSVQQ